MNEKQIRIVFMGTPDFAVESLKQLIENEYNVVGVITAPDRPAGRGRKLQCSAVKQYALDHNLPILQPEKLKDSDFIEALKMWKADLQVVVAFRMLPEIVWNMPSMGTFNLHGSLLPKYRGAAPLNWAIINGDKETGVTTFLLKHEIDTGNVLFSEKIAISDQDNVGTIHDRLMVIGGQLVIKTVNALATDSITPISQDQLIEKGYLPCPAPKIFKQDCKINWEESIDNIFNLVRGLSPYPAAWTELQHTSENKSTSAKIFVSEKVKTQHAHSFGTIESDGKSFLYIYGKEGYLDIKEIQLAGKKRMKIEDMLRGFNQITEYTAIK